MTGNWQVDGLSVDRGGFTLGPIDLAIAPGETVAVIGRSGSGKTTLLRALAGFAPLSGGSVERDGESLGSAPPERRGAVYVPAGLGLFPDRTVRSNLEFPGRVRGTDDPAAVSAAADRFGVREFLERYPRTLSEGQRERVAVARATLARPSLLLWDEPLGALDVESRRDLLAALGELRRVERFPVVLVTHDPALGFSLADRFLVLDGGRATFSGPGERLVAAPTDAFVGRFVGYPNVFETDELAPAAGRSELARALIAGSGPSGVGAPAFPIAPAGPGTHAATVERVVPGPEGHRVFANAGGLSVVLSSDVGVPPGTCRVGDPVWFVVDPERLHPLGGSGRTQGP